MKKASAAAAVAAVVVGAEDAFHGQGGSYVLDPETGKRELVERTLSREEAAELEQVPVVPQAEEGGA